MHNIRKKRVVKKKNKKTVNKISLLPITLIV